LATTARILALDVQPTTLNTSSLEVLSVVIHGFIGCCGVDREVSGGHAPELPSLA